MRHKTFFLGSLVLIGTLALAAVWLEVFGASSNTAVIESEEVKILRMAGLVPAVHSIVGKTVCIRTNAVTCGVVEGITASDHNVYLLVSGLLFNGLRIHKLEYDYGSTMPQRYGGNGWYLLDSERRMRVYPVFTS